MNEAYIGKICPYCKGKFTADDNIVKCSACDMPHHRDCWIENEGCTTFGCAGTIQSIGLSTDDDFEIEIHDNDEDKSDGCLDFLYCDKCGTKVMKEAAFCFKCGNKIKNNDAFCVKCGNSLGDNMQFCPKCGAAVTGSQNQSNYTYASQQSGYNCYNHFTSLNSDFSDVQKNKGISILSYFGVLLLIPLLLRPNSQFVRFHANQGLILLITQLVLSVICIIPFINVIGWIAEIVLLIWGIKGIVNCVKGEAKEIPVIGKYKIIK